MLCIAALLIVMLPSDGKAGVPLKEKYSSQNNWTGEEYSTFTKYPYYAEIAAGYEADGVTSADASPVAAPADQLRIAGDQQPRLERQIGGRAELSFVWEEMIDWAEWDFDITVPGLYAVEVDYYMLPGSGNPATRSLMVDGEVPFLEALSIVFPRKWRDKGEPVVNSLGDETRPGQEEIPQWSTIRLTDDAGMYARPFELYLDAGQHTLRLQYVDQAMAIAQVSLVPLEPIPSYTERLDEYRSAGYTEAGQTLKFEAELQAVEKSQPTIRRESHGDPLVSPPSLKNRVLNVIGGWPWRKGNQAVTWEFEAPEDGLYKIGVRALQTWNDGLPSYRQIAIDGVVPFQEFETYKFDYSTKWDLHTLQADSGEPFHIYLTKGKHRLTMTVKLGELAPILRSMNEDNLLLSQIIRDITKIAGNEPDPNYDYDFFTAIPTLRGNMEHLIASLQAKYDRIKGLADKLPAMANNLLTIQDQLNHMIEDPFIIAGRMKDLNNAQNSLGTWYTNMQSQPLMIDYMQAGPPSDQWANPRSSFWQRLRASISNFFLSFQKDYDSIGHVLGEGTEITTTIDVWIARGVEWAEIIKEMADEQFTPQTGIAINMNVLPANQLEAGSINALMLAIASGNAPDVGLGVDAASPVEFAIRDTVYDLSQFPDFEQVSERFIPNIMIPFRYRGGVYGLPETMNFSVMYYRKDIVEELGVRLPDTRDDLYHHTLPVLYQNGLQFYYPQDFTPFLFQHGGDFYTEDSTRSALDTPMAFRAFQEYTELFTNYGVPVVADFYNRLRTGEMPMGIGDFGTYLQLSVAAPEIAGRWGIAPIPGRMQDDGVVDRATGLLAGQSAVIMKQSEHSEQSWEFLKWWMSEDVQTSFARELEALIGVEARWNTANVEAFSNLSWRKEDLDVIREMWKFAEETPVVLGGYYTLRYINNAWNSVVLDNENVRETLEKGIKEINRELRMKQEEYGFVTDQE